MFDIPSLSEADKATPSDERNADAQETVEKNLNAQSRSVGNDLSEESKLVENEESIKEEFTTFRNMLNPLREITSESLKEEVDSGTSFDFDDCEQSLYNFLQQSMPQDVSLNLAETYKKEKKSKAQKRAGEPDIDKSIDNVVLDVSLNGTVPEETICAKQAKKKKEKKQKRRREELVESIVNTILQEEFVPAERKDESESQPKRKQKRSSSAIDFSKYFYPDHSNSDELPENTRKSTKNDFDLKIELSHPVPELHKIETRITHSPKPEQWRRISELNLEINQGLYSSQENAIILKNWSDFCKSHQVPNDPLLFINTTSSSESIPELSYKERIKFVQYLAQGLDKRLLYSVYTRFKIMHRKLRSGKFSKKEDEYIMKTFEMDKSSKAIYSVIARKLNRDRKIVIKRHQWLIERSENNLQVGKVSRKKLSKFVRKLLVCTESESIDNLKNKLIVWNVFQHLGLKLQVAPKTLCYYWYHVLHPQLFVTGTRDIAEVRRKLYQLILLDETVYDKIDICYSSYMQHFDGWTPLALRSLVMSKLRGVQNEPEIYLTIKDQIAFLLEKAKSEKSPKTKLRKAFFTNGRLLFERK